MPQTNFSSGIENWLRTLGQYATRPFQPGQRMDIIHGGILDPNVPGSLANSAWSILGKPFGMEGAEAAADAQRGIAFANAPVTGPALPKQPPAAREPAGDTGAAMKPFMAGWALTSTPGDPRDGGRRRHQGWDFAPTGGDPNIRAPKPFEVIATSRSEKGGNIATVKFDDGSQYKLMHLAQLPPVGHRGAAGSVIASAGRTGNATGTTVHVQPVGNAPPPTSLFGGGGGRAGPNLQAFQSAAGAVGLNQPPPGFNTAGFAAADQALQQVQGLSMQPFSGTYKPQELPVLPEPTQLQAPDYSAGDAAFAAAQPKNPFGVTPEEQEKGQLKVRRAEYFSGMAQALASINWSNGPGLGELFAKLGAGALMGAKEGDEEVRKRLDKFDAAMQSYNLAVANRDDGKARDASNIANQNIQGMNQYKRDLWSTQVKEIEKFQPRIENGVMVTFDKKPDGTVTETHTPLDQARQTAAIMARANNQVAAANASNEYNWQTYRINREVAGAALPYAMADAMGQGNAAGRDGIFAVGLMESVNAVTETGQWKDVYRQHFPGRAEAVEREAYANAGLQVDQNGIPLAGQKMTEAQKEQVNNYVASQMATDFVNGGKTWVLIGGNTKNEQGTPRGPRNPDPRVTSSVAQQRDLDRKVRRTTDSKGRVSMTESY